MEATWRVGSACMSAPAHAPPWGRALLGGALARREPGRGPETGGGGMGGAPAWSELPGERTLSAPGQGGAGPGPSVPTELRPPPHRACPLPGSQPRSSPPPLTGPHRRVGICAAPGLGTAEPGWGERWAQLSVTLTQGHTQPAVGPSPPRAPAPGRQGRGARLEAGPPGRRQPLCRPGASPKRGVRSRTPVLLPRPRVAEPGCAGGRPLSAREWSISTC